MSRAHVTVRPASSADASALTELWGELRAATGGGLDRLVGVTSGPQMAARLLGEPVDPAEQADPAEQLLVAVVDGEVGGMTLLRRDTLGPLCDAPAVTLDYLVVARRHQHRGVGRALLLAATSYAEQYGAEHVAVSVWPTLRDANRFYARLGFTPVTVRRVAAVGALRRKLGVDPRPRRALGLAHRRSVRARARAQTRAALARLGDGSEA